MKNNNFKEKVFNTNNNESSEEYSYPFLDEKPSREISRSRKLFYTGVVISFLGGLIYSIGRYSSFQNFGILPIALGLILLLISLYSKISSVSEEKKQKTRNKKTFDDYQIEPNPVDSKADQRKKKLKRTMLTVLILLLCLANLGMGIPVGLGLCGGEFSGCGPSGGGAEIILAFWAGTIFVTFLCYYGLGNSKDRMNLLFKITFTLLVLVPFLLIFPILIQLWDEIGYFFS